MFGIEDGGAKRHRCFARCGKKCVEGFSENPGRRGLYLRLEKLSALGANPNFIHEWSTGVSLGAAPAHPLSRRNHPSLSQNSSAADEEWSRLQKLGKVEFFSGGKRPPKLNINPCALILKEAPVNESGGSTVKKRLILDLRRGQVNERLPAVDVDYGTVDIAASRISKGDFYL